MKLRSLVDRLRGKSEQGTASADPDERWSNQYREREKNSIYKWVGVRSGGELIGVYEKWGEEGVLSFAQEKMESMLYNEGQAPQMIKFADYVRWKKSVNLALGITEEEDSNEANSNFREHEAQWRLNKRGVDGETLVHLLLNREELVCQEIARILINKYPGLAKDIYLGEDLFGQGCLHLAIVHDDYDTVQLLLENGASVNARATGDFFMPEDFADQDYRTMSYEGYAYYGEYPLAFAACFQNKDIYDLLIQYGANPDMQDVFGNTTLHMCVIHNRNLMYSYAVRHWHKPAHTHIANHAGYTPLTLSTKLGRRQIFAEMLELTKVEFWRFSDMTCSAYPLDALDTIRPDGSTNYDSALMTVINGDTKDHLDMIGSSEVIQRLLADKWKAFAGVRRNEPNSHNSPVQRKWFERLVLLVLHLFCISIIAYLRPAEQSRLYLENAEWDDWVRVAFECLTVLSCCWFVLVQQMGELRTQGFRAYWRNLVTAPSKVVYQLSNLLFLACVPVRLLGLYQVEDALLSFALPCSWVFLLFFARSAKLTGPFVQMIYSMIEGDLVRFATISAIFLIPFSQIFYFLCMDMAAKQNLDPADPNFCSQNNPIIDYDSFLDTFMTLFRICMNAINYDELACSNYEPLTKLVFVLFMFVMAIMMINILIAMINNTYTDIIEQAEKAWRQQYAQIVMSLERSMDQRKLAACQLEYSIRMNDPGRETRGLMVIKQTTKTRAKQRREAIANWKSMGRKVITMARELGTESTRYLLHSHDKLVTDETVEGAASHSGMASKASFNPTLMRPVSNAVGGFNSPSSQEVAWEADVGDEYGRQVDEGDRRRNSTARRPSVPNLQYPRMSIPNLERNLVLMESSALRKVVMHAKVNNVKLKQALTHKQVLPGAGLSDRQLANGNVLPGSTDVARRTANNSPPHGLRPFSAGGLSNHLQVPPNPVPAPQRQIAHITQRQLTSVPGSRTRGIQMLPSVDVPNIPAAESAKLVKKEHSVIAMELDGGTEEKRRNTRGRRDLFRKKDSPPVQKSKEKQRAAGAKQGRSSSYNDKSSSSASSSANSRA